MTSSPPTVHVSGAGPAGFAAAITAARGGAKVIVHERQNEVGRRFHGDFQGLENWTTDGDAIDELASVGIEPSFQYTPFNEVVLFDPDGRAHLCRDARPIFYLVERGPGDRTIDQGLRRQALSLGVDLHLEATCRHLPDGGIVADGPKRADVIAVGYLFETDAANGAYCALSGRLASKGYAYLLVHAGRGVIATCMFDDFHNERYYLGQTVAFFESAVGITMRHVRRFGGAGNYSVPNTARKGSILYAGESAGFQDALAGFGMRYALLTGHLAARALLGGEPERYDALWRARFGAQLRASIVNRYLYAVLGEAGRRRLAVHHTGPSSGRARLRRRYANSVAKTLLYPIARRAVGRRARATCQESGCNCTWCCCHGSFSGLEDATPGPDPITAEINPRRVP
jgi:flavin-dependent dehydrogenase